MPIPSSVILSKLDDATVHRMAVDGPPTITKSQVRIEAEKRAAKATPRVPPWALGAAILAALAAVVETFLLVLERWP